MHSSKRKEGKSEHSQARQGPRQHERENELSSTNEISEWAQKENPKTESSQIQSSYERRIRQTDSKVVSEDKVDGTGVVVVCVGCETCDVVSDLEEEEGNGESHCRQLRRGTTLSGEA